MEEKVSYTGAFVCALLLHLSLFSFALFKHQSSFTSVDDKVLGNPDVVDSDTTEVDLRPMQAVKVDEKELNAEIARINAREIDKRDKIEKKEKEVNSALSEIALEKQKLQTELETLKEEEKKVAETKKREEEAKAKADAKAKAEAELALKKQQAEEKAAAEKKLKEKVAAAKKAAEARTQANASSEPVKSAAGDPNATLALQSRAEIERYTLLVRRKIEQYWALPSGLHVSDPMSRLYVRVSPHGIVLEVKVLQSSGNEAFDRSAVSAVYKASPLPVPTDPQLFKSFEEMRLTLKPSR